MLEPSRPPMLNRMDNHFAFDEGISFADKDSLGWPCWRRQNALRKGLAAGDSPPKRWYNVTAPCDV